MYALRRAIWELKLDTGLVGIVDISQFPFPKRISVLCLFWLLRLSARQILYRRIKSVWTSKLTARTLESPLADRRFTGFVLFYGSANISRFCASRSSVVFCAISESDELCSKKKGVQTT